MDRAANVCCTRRERERDLTTHRARAIEVVPLEDVPGMPSFLLQLAQPQHDARAGVNGLDFAPSTPPA